MAYANPRYEDTANRIRAFLSGRQRTPLISVYSEPKYRQQADPEVMVAQACQVIAADIRSNEPHILPSFFPDFGTVSTAAMYGGQRIPAENGGCIHIEPIAQTAEQLLNLAPCAFEESDYQRAINLYRAVCERLGTDDIFMRTPDFQGPLNTLALLLDQTELMLGMMEQPDLIGELVDRITGTLISYTDRFCREIGRSRVIGSIWPYIALPDGAGISITQDYMPLLGPEQYAKFEIPHLKRIAEHFGGVYIHCCGKFAQHLPNLAASGIKILGFETHYPETKVEDIFAVFGDRVAITPYVAPTGAAEFPTLESLVRSWQGTAHAKARFWFCTCREWGDVAALRNAVREVCT